MSEASGNNSLTQTKHGTAKLDQCKEITDSMTVIKQTIQEITVLMKDEALLHLPLVTVGWRCCTTGAFFMRMLNNVSAFFIYLYFPVKRPKPTKC